MNKLLYACAVILLLAACKEDAKKEPETIEITETDSTDIDHIDTVLSAETIQQFSTNGFTDYAKKRVPSFDWSQFRMTGSWVDSTPLVSDFKPEKSFFNNYGAFLKYSPDSTSFIDLDSYNIDIVKDKKGNFTGKELGPDTEISLVDVNTKKKTRLLFMGPGGSVEDGAWLDNNTLVLIGVQDNEEQIRTASLWRYDVPTHTYYVYESPDTTLAAKIPGFWKDERLKKVKVQ